MIRRLLTIIIMIMVSISAEASEPYGRVGVHGTLQATDLTSTTSFLKVDATTGAPGTVNGLAYAGDVKGQLKWSTVKYTDITTSANLDLRYLGFRTVDAPSGTDPVADLYTDTLTLSTGGGLTIVGDASTDSLVFSHLDTSSQASVDNSGLVYIQDITLDTYGHVTALASTTIQNANADNTTKGVATYETSQFTASSGVVFLRYIPARAILDYYADAGNGTTVETDLYSDSIPGGTLASNGDKLIATYAGTYAGISTTTPDIRVYFGGTKIYDSGAITIGANVAWQCTATIIRESSSVVRCSTTLITTVNTATATTNQYARVTALVLSVGNGLKITGQSTGVGAATNDIIAKFGSVKYEPAAL